MLRFPEIFLYVFAPVVIVCLNLISGTTVAGYDLDMNQVPQGCKTYDYLPKLLLSSMLYYAEIHYTDFLALHEKD